MRYWPHAGEQLELHVIVSAVEYWRPHAAHCWYPYISRPRSSVVQTDARLLSDVVHHGRWQNFSGFGWRNRMLWVGIGIALVVVLAVGALIVGRRPADDLGSVSDHWISHHRADAP
jgi:hypothetical protein